MLGTANHHDHMSDVSNSRKRRHRSRSRITHSPAVIERGNERQGLGHRTHAIATHLGDLVIRLLRPTWSRFRRWGLRPLYFVALSYLSIGLLAFFYAQPVDCRSSASQVTNDDSGIAIELNGTGTTRITREAVAHLHATKSTLIHVHEAFHAIYCDTLAFADGFLEMHTGDAVSASLEYFVHRRRGQTVSPFSGICPTEYHVSPTEAVPLTPRAAQSLSVALYDVLVLTEDLTIRSGKAATHVAIVMNKSDFAAVEREAEAKDTFLWTRWFTIGDAIQDECSLQLQHPSLTVTLDYRHTLKPLHWLLKLASISTGMPSHAEYVYRIIDRIATLASSVVPPLKTVSELVPLERPCASVVDRCRAASDLSFEHSTPWYRIPFTRTKDCTVVFLGDLGGKLDNMCGMVRVNLAALALPDRHRLTYEAMFSGWTQILLEMQKKAVSSLQYQGHSGRFSPALSELLKQWADIERKFHPPQESEKGEGSEQER